MSTPALRTIARQFVASLVCISLVDLGLWSPVSWAIRSFELDLDLTRGLAGAALLALVVFVAYAVIVVLVEGYFHLWRVGRKLYWRMAPFDDGLSMDGPDWTPEPSYFDPGTDDEEDVTRGKSAWLGFSLVAVSPSVFSMTLIRVHTGLPWWAVIPLAALPWAVLVTATAEILSKYRALAEEANLDEEEREEDFEAGQRRNREFWESILTSSYWMGPGW